MTYWASKDSISNLDEVGGKGLHLQKLCHWGARVSPFFVLTTECFRFFKSSTQVPPAVEQKFAEFFQEHPTIALRSSMIAEDNVDSSFAGMFETVLDVTKENWKESLIRIYGSVHAPRVKEYLERKNLKTDLQMAVVAQAQVNVEKSGVLFTRSPVTPTAAIAIDAAFGMGEGVVSGHSKVDHYQFTRTGDLILRLKNNDETVLTRKEQEELISVAITLEAAAGMPSDIEWGYKDSKLYIFQIRPITRAFEPLTYFVDTNLSESYPGTVSPFSAKFVQKAYHYVFRESAILLGAKGRRLDVLDSHYARLISHVDDHLYYNLEHYYAVLRALPGGEKNIDNWHKMIGGKLPDDKIPKHATELTQLETIQGLTAIIRIGWNHKKIFSALLSRLELVQKKILQDMEHLNSSDQIIEFHADLTERPLGFGLTVVNDVFIMMGLGLLTRTFKKRGIREENIIDILRTSDGVDSLKPLELFNSLVHELPNKFIEKFESLVQPAGFDPYRETLKELRQSGFETEVRRVEDFLEKYGDRSFEELKLESLPLRNNPALFVQLIKWTKSKPETAKPVTHGELNIQLGWLEDKCLKFTRQCIAMREATRLWRGKYYHLHRVLLLKLGQKLQEEDLRWREFSVLDFFSLNHLEWKAFRQGRINFNETRRLIVDRRPWQTKRQQYPEMILWVESEHLPKVDHLASESDLTGQGVSPGVAEGVALVLENPHEALASDLKDFILVTKNTDPAWVYIMSRSLGLISEKGSLLSHTAIIGRELAIPTIVGVKSATGKIKTGDRIRMDATSGKVEVL